MKFLSKRSLNQHSPRKFSDVTMTQCKRSESKSFLIIFESLFLRKFLFKIICKF